MAHGADRAAAGYSQGRCSTPRNDGATRYGYAREYRVSQDNYYECVGICQPDPVIRLCQGCGRPWDDSPLPVSQQSNPVTDRAADEVAPGTGVSGGSGGS